VPTAKQRILKIVRAQPDDSSFDEILRELLLDRMVQRGLEDSVASRTINHQEMVRRVKTWRR